MKLQLNHFKNMVGEVLWDERMYMQVISLFISIKKVFYFSAKILLLSNECEKAAKNFLFSPPQAGNSSTFAS